MIDVTGNLWDYPADVRAITTNGFRKRNGACVMGRGCAQEARDRWPGLDLRLGALIGLHGNRCFRIPLDTFTLLSFPVKPVTGPAGEPGWQAKAQLQIIQRSALEAMAMADKFGWERIVVPRPGCGNGGLRWPDVKLSLSDALDDRFHIITFA
jgi:hypothetical protein